MSFKSDKIIIIALAGLSAFSSAAAVMTMAEKKEAEERMILADASLDASNKEIERLRDELSKAQTASVTEETEHSETGYMPPVIDENTVYIYDNGDTVVEYPPVEGAVFHDYDMKLLQTDDKKHKTLYDSEENKRSRFGIDVSSYQTDIDWNAVKADGVEFAFIRAGYRGYETGQLCEDRYFRRNMEGTAAADIDRGVYFYSQAITEEEAVEEAEYVISLLEEAGVSVTLPVVYDWEFPADEDPARTDDLSGEMQTKCCRAFCDRIREAGYEVMYYSTISTALFRYDMGELSDIPLWMAEYCAETDFVYDFKMWQYSCSGVIDGIEGLVDLNLLIEK